ncbi:baculoviral IAP repeat-containing protein 5b isoform X1 [Oncorhynchus tshawytscha]|uniref:Uncharacterized protein n=1 Tax=Oncorhynchus tshawytscha TaxID=74940 RepID=A0A8C8DAP7_ONCTS|nr:baculoviral IAP repeat-containing protein 5b isoform X1 [Oncorhynchus tshawytscha]
MASLNDLSARFYSYNKMYSYEMRLQSFADWPFREECQCTPEMMATAGFVHCPSVNEPDVACCFFCLRELEGWEPEDNPWSEHIKRSPNCGFLAMKKDFGELTVAEFYHLEQERLRIYIVCHQPYMYINSTKKEMSSLFTFHRARVVTEWFDVY